MADVKLRYNKASAQYLTVDESYELLQKMGCNFSKHQLRKLISDDFRKENPEANHINFRPFGAKKKLQLSSLLKYLNIEYEEIGEIEINGK